MEMDRSLISHKAKYQARQYRLSTSGESTLSNDDSKDDINISTIFKSSSSTKLYTAVIPLITIFEKIILQRYKNVFKNLEELYAVLLQERNKKKINEQTCLSKNNTRQKLLKYIKIMIFTGKVNVIQRVFWKWKFQISPKLKIVIESMKKDTKSTLRALWNRYTHKITLEISSIFLYWKNIKTNHLNTKDLNREKIHNVNWKFSLCYLQSLIQRRKMLYFQILYEIPVKRSSKVILSYMNTIFKKRIKKYFQRWADDILYTYTETVEEIVNLSNKQTKIFSLTTKPCVHLYYYDYHTYDPTYRVVSRNLNHFIKKKIYHYMRRWSLNSKKAYYFDTPGSISPIKSGTNYNFYKLSPENSIKLKDVVIHLYFINQKLSEMPSLSFSAWSQAATIKNLKINRLKKIMLKNQIKIKSLENIFSKFQSYTVDFDGFTDYY